MAFVFNPNKDKDKNNVANPQALGQGQALSQGQGSVITGQNQAAAAPGAQKASSSGRFSNIQQFVKANDPRQLAGQVTGKIGEEKGKAAGQLQEAKSEVDRSAQSTGEAVAAAKAKLQGSQQGLQGAYAAQGGPVAEDAFKQNLEGFKQGMGMQYQGAEDLGNQGALRTQAQSLQAMGQATQNASGRSALLNRFFGNPQYAQGQRTLDTVLLGSQRPALQQAAAQANVFGGELDTARRAALAQIAQARGNVTGVQQEARQGVESQIGAAKGAISERAAQAQQIRDLLRKPDAEMQMQQDVNQPAITGDARSDAALRQALQSGFMQQADVDKYKALQERLGNVGYTARNMLERTLLEGEETGDELTARAASQQQASRIAQLQGLIGQQGSYNPYAYDPNAAEGLVNAREDEIFNALGNTDFDFSKDYSQKQDVVATAAKMGLIALPMAPIYLGAQGVKGANEKLDPYLSKDKTGISRLALQSLTGGQLGASQNSPLKYLSVGQYADSLGNVSNEFLDKIPGMGKMGSAVSQAVNNQKVQRAAAAIGTAGGSEVWRGLGGIAKKFCFAPDTLVKLANGQSIQIQDIKLGDEMEQGGIVYSISSHLVDESQVYEYNGIIVTANHAVYENGRWIRVENSRVAKPAPGATSVVYSLSNMKHRIVTDSAVFADYDEVDNSEGLNDHQCLKILNRSK